MFSFENQVAVVTGASSGLGRQIARTLAKQGANLVILARRLERLEELKVDIESNYQVQVLPIQCDVTNTENIRSAAEQTESYFGRVDVLINCAGAAKNAGVLDMTDDEWNFTIDVDESSVFKVTREFASLMKKRKYGRIVNIASMYGLVGNTKIPTIAYHTSKGAVVNFTRAVAAELARYNITCNCICPGYFETELTKETLDTDDFQAFAKQMVPMGRYGKEGELNPAIIFLASEEASYVNGAILPVDGGYTAI